MTTCPPLCGSNCCDDAPCMRNPTCNYCGELLDCTCLDGTGNTITCSEPVPSACLAGTHCVEDCDNTSWFNCENDWYCTTVDNPCVQLDVSDPARIGLVGYAAEGLCNSACVTPPPTYYVCSGIPGSNACNVSPTTTPYTDIDACQAACFTNWLYSCSGAPLYICEPGVTGFPQSDCERFRQSGGSCTAPIQTYTCSGPTGTGGNPPYTCYNTTPIGTIISICSPSCVAPPPTYYKCNGAPNYNCTPDGVVGDYTIELDCQSACHALPTKWSCSNNICTESAPGGTGTWNTQAECVDSNTCGTWKCISDFCRFFSNDDTGYTLESDCNYICNKVWCCTARCGCTSLCGVTTCRNITMSECNGGTTYLTQSTCESSEQCCGGSHYECKFKPGQTADVPGNKECVNVNGARDITNPNHFNTEAACKSDCGNSYNCINCDCGISTGLNGSELFSTCDAICPDKTYSCDNGKCIPDICPSPGNPGLSYADCKLQCGRYRCPGVTTTTGSVIAWGCNSFGQCLGTCFAATDNPTAARWAQTEIAPWRRVKGTDITNNPPNCANFNTIPFEDTTQLNNVFLSGVSVPGTLRNSNLPNRPIGGGYYFSCAIKNTKVYCWGRNHSAGDGTPARGGLIYGTDNMGQALQVNSDGGNYSNGGPVRILGNDLTGIVDISCGLNHTLAMKSGYGLVAWGDNNQGQCNIPVAFTGNDHDEASYFSAGYRHSVGTRFGVVYAWGSNEYGQVKGSAAGGVMMSDLSTDPGDVVRWNGSILVNATGVAAGGAFSLAIINGSIYGWGSNIDGCCLGTDGGGRALTSAASAPITSPVKINGTIRTDFINVQASQRHACAIVSNGSLYCWGNNDYGQCNVIDLTQVMAVHGKVSQVACGGFSTMVLMQDGYVYAWGAGNSSGTPGVAYGIGGPHAGQSIVPSNARSGVTSIASGSNHNLAITSAVTTTQKACDFYGDTDNGYTSNALCELATTCHPDPKFECVYTACPNGRVLGSTCSPTTTFVDGITYYDTYGQCQDSPCMDSVDLGNRYRCVNNACEFISYCDGDGTYRELTGPGGCSENCYGWNCINNQCQSQSGAPNNHDNCAESCHCKWSAINLSNQSGRCPTCIKLCGRELAVARASNSPCSDEWATTCPVAYGYYDNQTACEQFLIDNNFGEYTCKEDGTCQLISSLPADYPICGRSCNKATCESGCMPVGLNGYVCVEPEPPYSGIGVCHPITSCDGTTNKFDTLLECETACNHVVSRGWNCIIAPDGSPNCIPLTRREDGIPEFTSIDMCNIMCINNFGWNCNSTRCDRAWEGPGEFSTYDECAGSGCIVTDFGWNCIDNVCDPALVEPGTFSSYEICQSSCFVPPPPDTNTTDFGWNCTGINYTSFRQCTRSLGSSGEFSSYEECTSSCIVPDLGWNCNGGACAPARNTPGTFSSYERCYVVCNSSIDLGWNCVNERCIRSEVIPGLFSSYVECAASCNVSDFGWNCIGNTCARASGTTGTFSSYRECAGACIIPNQDRCGNVIDTSRRLPL